MEQNNKCANFMILTLFIMIFLIFIAILGLIISTQINNEMAKYSFFVMLLILIVIFIPYNILFIGIIFEEKETHNYIELDKKIDY